MPDEVQEVPLDRKYRPQRFSQVVGQDAAVERLRNAVRSGRVAGSYLLVGPSGTGKTTLARILARAANCTDPKDGEPCDTCESCRLILEERTLDFLLLDSATDRGINGIRYLSSVAGRSPLHCRYRVFLLDEAHDLTKEAREALLHHLEEPPPNAIFILASTRMDFEETLVSRCTLLQLKPIRADLMARRLVEVAEAEGYPICEEAALQLVRQARRNFRAAFKLLDGLLNHFLGRAIIPLDDELGEQLAFIRSMSPLPKSLTQPHPQRRGASAPRSAGRPSKDQERVKVILAVVKDGDWHLWNEVTKEGKKKGIRDVGGMQQTRERLEEQGVIEVEHTGRDVRIRLADHPVNRAEKPA